jgi:hypothetical protein
VGAHQVRSSTFACLGYVLAFKSSCTNSWLEFQLNLAFEMKDMSSWFQLAYMNWERYKSATLDRAGSDWDSLTGADLIVGGLNFSMDFMCITFFLKIWKLESSSV